MEEQDESIDAFLRKQALLIAADTYKQFVDPLEAIDKNIIIEAARAFYDFLKGDTK